MTHPQATKAKYRPVLTAAQITHILNLAKLEFPLTDQSISVIATLSPFVAKIENAGINPAYEIKPAKPSTLESLGGVGTEEKEAIANTFNNTTGKTKEEYWQACYYKYQSDAISCTLDEIRAAQEHKYLNDLMTPEEQLAFEGNLQE